MSESATMDPPATAPPVAEDDGLGGYESNPIGRPLTAEEAALRHHGVPADYIPEESEFTDPNSYFRTNIPGGAQPQDDGYQAPIPPADLTGTGSEEAEEKEKDPLLFLLGHKELGLKVGGRKPDTSELGIKGGKVELEGQFDREDRFLAVFTLQVTGDNDVDAIELDTGTVKSTKKKQQATICATSTLSAFLARKLEDHPDLYRALVPLLELEAD